ncbi:pantothenate transporter liz1 [Arthroderma uncinatum]|uniref:pantothenate transporter liz1 n=1 Tax=Arthroderma uncinatum TaxID=74035 RepID=UPI00144A8124|nr:pantothenate transporter liz1 [Arthroderma uncinatum]KAF3484383.1 pantothenate transporter liz1 [Arthroderma uncinatum]
MEKQAETAQVEVAAVDAERGGSHENAHPSPEVMYIDPELERRVVRKIDTRLLSLVCFLSILAYIDRGNLGNARIAGMDVDLNLFGDRFDWPSTIFFIPFVIFHLQVVMWKSWRHDYTAAATVLGW